MAQPPADAIPAALRRALLDGEGDPFAGAVVTPAATRRMRPQTWIVVCCLLATVIAIGGMAACLMILLFVRYELSYDRWLPHAEDTYQLQA